METRGNFLEKLKRVDRQRKVTGVVRQLAGTPNKERYLGISLQFESNSNMLQNTNYPKLVQTLIFK